MGGYFLFLLFLLEPSIVRIFETLLGEMLLAID